MWRGNFCERRTWRLGNGLGMSWAVLTGKECLGTITTGLYVTLFVRFLEDFALVPYSWRVTHVLIAS